MQRSLQGIVVAVTGGRRGIGKGIALAFGDAGAVVYVSGRILHNRNSQWPGSITATATCWVQTSHGFF